MTDVQTTFQQAFESHRAGLIAEAASGYAAVLKTDPYHPSALHLSGLIDHKMGRYTEAVSKIKLSLRLAPNELQWALNLGKILMDKGEHEGAALAFTTALQLDPNCKKARQYLLDIENPTGSAMGTPYGSGQGMQSDTSWNPPFPLTPDMINTIRIENIDLGEIKVAEFEEYDGETCLCVKKITESAPFKLLCGDTGSFDRYLAYIRSNKKFRFDLSGRKGVYKIKASIEKNGYPFAGNYICFYENEKIIRDGRNRAAVLRFLWGERIVPVVRFTSTTRLHSFEPPAGKQRMVWSIP